MLGFPFKMEDLTPRCCEYSWLTAFNCPPFSGTDSAGESCLAQGHIPFPWQPRYNGWSEGLTLKGHPSFRVPCRVGWGLGKDGGWTLHCSPFVPFAQFSFPPALPRCSQEYSSPVFLRPEMHLGVCCLGNQPEAMISGDLWLRCSQSSSGYVSN